MLTNPDYFRIAVEAARLQFPTPRLVDRVFAIELEERAIRERNTELLVKAVRDTLYSADATDPRRI